VKNKRLVLILGLSMLLGLPGCGAKDNAETPAAVAEEETTDTDTSDEGTAEVTEEAEPETETEETEDAADADKYTDIYYEVLDKAYVLIYSHGLTFDPEEYVYDLSGVYEVANYRSDAMDVLGYKIEDLSGDGVPELIIGDAKFDKTVGDGIGHCIYGVYTVVDDKPVQVITGWARNTYYLCEKNQFFNMGSGGAMYSSVGLYALNEDGVNCKCLDFFFTSPVSDDFVEYALLHNTTGDWDVDSAEVIESTEDGDDVYTTFLQLEDNYSAMVIDPELTPFSEYNYEGDLSAYDEELNTPLIRVADYDTSISDTSNMDKYVSSTSEYATDIVIVADRSVSDVKILDLDFVEFDETTNEEIYNTKVAYEKGYMTSWEMMVLTVEPVETISSVGVSYTNLKGETAYYAVTQSGFDGSFSLIPIKSANGN